MPQTYPNAFLANPLARSESNQGQTHNGHAFMTGPVTGSSPFRVRPDDRLLVLKFTCISHVTNHGTFTIFVRAAGVVAQARNVLATRSGSSQPVPWDAWGRQNTRWLRNLFPNPFVCNMHGLRFLTMASTTRRLALSIMDFNSYRIRRDRTSQVAAATDNWEVMDKVHTRLVLEPSVISIPSVFRETFVTELPYRETRIPGVDLEASGALLLDDERVLVFDVRTNSGWMPPKLTPLAFRICAKSL